MRTAPMTICFYEEKFRMKPDIKAMRTLRANTAPRMAALFALALFAMPASAQVTRVNTVLTNFEMMLIGISVVIVTIALLWVGYKMVFQHAKWSEVSNILIGAIIIGGAPGFAAWMING